MRFVMLLTGMLASAAQAQDVSGGARAVDGDTLAMSGYRIRLMGIDAPEKQQMCERKGVAWACGAEASARLAELVAGQEVRCEGQGQDHYGRLVAICRTGGLDVGRAMVEAGLAVVRPNGAESYGTLEAQVRKAGWGLWAGRFDRPADWRAANKAEEPMPPPARKLTAKPQVLREQVYRGALGCTIKGNHSWSGEWIYHLPGTKHYAETRPEAWFCTEREALAAGYRRARND